ncbi:uncharacterized protein LOC126787219 [Argentina anserina]|uniref:uncharacterized protein LOC126787219 n=1 Tax=Argentina anserina TaxID=57926 RepID=UPI0021763914|nr:uncharacterized protein LOC126787219 [Potentilla anserina]
MAMSSSVVEIEPSVKSAQPENQCTTLEVCYKGGSGRGYGVIACPKVTSEQQSEMLELLDSCQQQLSIRAPKKVLLPPSSSLTGSGSSYFPLDERDSAAKKIRGMLQPIKKTWRETGVSLCTNGWTDYRRRPLINMMAACSNGAIMLKAINCEWQYKDKFEVSRLLLESVNEIGSGNVNTLKEKSHLLGEQVDEELGWLMKVVNNVYTIKNFILNHNMWLSMYNDHCTLKLLSVAETRFASHYVSLKRFKEVKNDMQQMVISSRWDMYKEDDVNKGRDVMALLLNNYFWEKIDCMIGFMGPIYEMIRMRDMDRPCLHLVYE